MRLRLALLAVGLAVAGAASAGDPPPERSSPPQDGDGGRSGAATPDDEFIEFLGADDVGDAAWWEFLKKSPPAEPVRDRDAKP